MKTPENIPSVQEKPYVPEEVLQNQAVKPPQTDSFPGYPDDDEESRHRGTITPDEYSMNSKVTPRNNQNGRPGFDAAEKKRNIKPENTPIEDRPRPRGRGIDINPSDL
jgi:hypothetical protein